MGTPLCKPLPHPPACSEPLGMAQLLALADADAQQRWDTLRLAYTETQVDGHGRGVWRHAGMKTFI